ncbi:hypothetical protein GH714_022937 [Hevea brasiliensis]|uniref:Uncharacterized protein n=1 Tax=Hevea brasiliensis TaxID=3981 RepID=A0A6A6MCQ2_HEVBR|nr:hypothetical protein GH714_022937 [Hevea brasiliensis]
MGPGSIILANLGRAVQLIPGIDQTMGKIVNSSSKGLINRVDASSRTKLLVSCETVTERARMMEKPGLSIAVLTLLYLLAQVIAIEKPQYEIVHAESDFEVRLYTQSTWMAAPVVQFIQGANLNWTRIPMTAPAVLV